MITFKIHPSSARRAVGGRSARVCVSVGGHRVLRRGGYITGLCEHNTQKGEVPLTSSSASVHPPFPLGARRQLAH